MGIESYIYHSKNQSMKKLLLFSIALILYCCSIAQTTILRDPQIEKMVSEVSKDSLQSYIQEIH
jgi:hypothetical protein